MVLTVINVHAIEIKGTEKQKYLKRKLPQRVVEHEIFVFTINVVIEQKEYYF